MDVLTTLAPRDLDQLQRSFRGDIITPGDETYDDARRLWNALVDRRPAVIVRPTSSDEVATAVRFGRDQGLEIAVRSGGHSHAGLRGADSGLVIDMSAMRGVEVDPEARTARANGGALLGELDVAAQAHGLVCPIGVIGHTGVAGLTLGGGIGRLQRQFGLTIDNLAAVELVTADGRLIRASETEEPELFWGMRGAGWNYGIATAFEFRLQPFGGVLNRGLLTFPATAIDEVWAVFREEAPRSPDSVAVIFGIDRAGPDDGYPEEQLGRPIVLLSWNHSGRPEDADADTAGLRRGPKPLTATIGSQPYLDVQTAHDLVLGWGRRSFIAGLNTADVRPEVFCELVDRVADAPGAGTFGVTAMGGAIARVDEDATAYAGRDAVFDLSADATWDEPASDDANIAWVRNTMAIIEPDATIGRYANENADVGPEATRLLYGDAKVPRLAALKRIWDPDNVFHVNHNIAPADG
jgi:FAD/FMN-containing dehydrogenase